MEKEKENGLLWLINEGKYENEDVEALINNSQKNNIILDINEKNEKGFYPLLLFSYDNKIDLMKLLMKYAEDNNIILDINSKDKNNYYPLFVSFENNNDEIADLLIKYANKHKIKLEVNEKFSNENYPILNSIINNNNKLTTLLIEYADENDIILDLNEKDIDNVIKDKIFDINSFSEINDNILKLLCQSYKNNKINITFSDHSVLSKKFNEISGEGQENDLNKSVIVTVKENNISKMKSLIDFADENNVILKINVKDENNCSPILWTIYQNNIELMKLLIDYADKNNILLEIDNYTLDLCIKRNYIEMIKLLTDYATKNNITLNVSTSIILEISSSNNYIEMANILFDFMNKNGIFLDINENDYNGNYPLLETTYYNNIEMMKLLMDYADKNDIILKINEKTYDGDFPLFNIIDKNYIEMIKLLMNYAYSHNLILNIKEKGFDGHFLITKSINDNKVEITKLLINYANNNDINLDIKEKDLCQISDINKDIIKLLYKCQKSNNNNLILDKESLLSEKFKEIENEILTEEKYFNSILQTIEENNIENMKTLMDLANEINVVINVNEKNNDGNYPLCLSINKNSFETTKLLMDYAIEHNIILSINEKDLQNISNLNEEIFMLLYENNNECKVFVTFNNKKSELSRLFEKISLFLSMKTMEPNKIGDIAIALYDFNGSHPIELNICKDEYLIVTSWNFKDGWAFGYKKDKPNNEGIFPVPLISRCNFNFQSSYNNTIHQNSQPLPEINFSNVDPLLMSNVNPISNSLSYYHPYPYPMYSNNNQQSPNSQNLPISPDLQPTIASPHLFSQSPISELLPLSPMSPHLIPFTSPILHFQQQPQNNENENQDEKISLTFNQDEKEEIKIPYPPSEIPYPPSKLPYPPSE
ncbi:hypothetical protein PIROE2DRAFT_21401 [Piromyces sp. E2]|nr:hypothetical protein PIROE2DRAFT_21401 [Piromyces sp. E2]|eukprot:OUM58125.1 hypothetical protein PIROE2DRAFT_21401 [Piromyces sp. E2]